MYRPYLRAGLRHFFYATNLDTTRLPGKFENEWFSSLQCYNFHSNQMLKSGEKLLHYKIISAIGKGGMGEVFLAQDTKLDRKVALKILPSEFAEDKDRMSRFVREAKSASALNHPNIITIYEIGEWDGTHFIATEFIDGKTLGVYAKANPLNYKSALEIAIQVASALDEAHHAGIVHRDIKPDNVMIRANGLVKLLDFGIAKLSVASPSARRSQPARSDHHSQSRRGSADAQGR